MMQQAILFKKSVGKRNRGTFELMLDVLRLLDCPCRQYRLAGMVGSTNSRLADLLPELEGRGLVQHDGLLYARTACGSELLNFLVTHGFPEYARQTPNGQQV